MKKLLFPVLFTVISILSSCGSAAKYYLINADMTRVNIGMTKEQVYEKIGKPNNIISARKTSEGTLEVLEYMRIEENSYTDKSAKRPIWVYFLDNELVEWGPGEDWQIDQAITDGIIERHKNRPNR